MEESKCQICLSNLENPVNFCSEIHEQFCRDCVVTHIECKVNEAFMGSCPVINCPSASHTKKRKTLVYELWKKTAKEEVVNRYTSLAGSLLAFLCGGCHALKTLDIGAETDRNASCFNKLDELLANTEGGRDRKAEFETMMSAYCNGDATMDDTYESLTRDIIPQVTTMNDSESWELFAAVLKTILNPERRVNLHLRYLRDRPRIKTLCCQREHCFRCKVKDYHEGKTCMEAIEQLDHSIVTCPNCGITLAKGDGCNTVTCVCGKQFSWSAEKENTERCQAFLRQYPSDTTNNCVKVLCATCTTFELQQAKAWQTRHRFEVNRAMKLWFKTKYWPCPSQCCTVLPLDSMPEGIREAVELWKHDHTNEVEKCKQQNAIALSSVFLNLYPNEEERPIAAHRIVYSSRRPSEHLIDQKVVQSAMKWIDSNRDLYNKALEEADQRSARQFLYLFGSKNVNNVKPAYVSSQSPHEWAKGVSNTELTFTNDNTSVERVGSVSCYPAAFANLVSERSSFKVIIDTAPRSSNWLTFGLARAGMPTSSSDGVGRTTNSWGISDDRSSSTVNAIVAANGSEVASFRKLKVNDILGGLVDTTEGWFEISINDTEFVHRFEIPPGSADDYWFAMTFANDHRVTILYEPMGTRKDHSPNAGELNPEHTIMYTNLRKHLKKLVSLDESEIHRSEAMFFLDNGTTWEHLHGDERTAMDAYEQLKPAIQDVLALSNRNKSGQKVQELNLSWNTLVQAISWFAKNKEKVRMERQVEMALNFKEAYCDDAAFIAATTLANYYNHKTGSEEEHSAIAYMNFFNDEMNDWYDFDMLSKDPLVEEVAKNCRCLPRHKKTCSIAKSK